MRNWLVGVFILVCTPIYAFEEASDVTSVNTTSIDFYGGVNDYCDDYFYPVFEDNWLDSVSMTHIPQGSLRIDYDGPRRVLMRQMQNQFRRLVRKYETESDDYETPMRLDRWSLVPASDDWWGRNWLDSLPSDKGGAPDSPYRHTIGKELEFRCGPLSITNTFKISIDYVAAFRFNTDPSTPQGKANNYKLAVDINSPAQVSTSTEFIFNFKPNIRIGLTSDDGTILGFLKNTSIRFELDIVVWGRTIIQSEFEVKYKGNDDVRIELSISLASW